MMEYLLHRLIFYFIYVTGVLTGIILSYFIKRFCAWLGMNLPPAINGVRIRWQHDTAMRPDNGLFISLRRGFGIERILV